MTRRKKAALWKFWVWYDILTNFCWALSDWVIPSLFSSHSALKSVGFFFAGPVGSLVLFAASLIISGVFAYQKYQKATDEYQLVEREKLPQPMTAKGMLKLTATVVFAIWPLLKWIMPSFLPSVLTPLLGKAATNATLAALVGAGTMGTGGVGTIIALSITAAIVIGVAAYRYWKYYQSQQTPINRFLAACNEVQNFPSSSHAQINHVVVRQSATSNKTNATQNLSTSCIDSLFCCLRPWSRRGMRTVNASEEEMLLMADQNPRLST